MSRPRWAGRTQGRSLIPRPLGGSQDRVSSRHTAMRIDGDGPSGAPAIGLPNPIYGLSQGLLVLALSFAVVGRPSSAGAPRNCCKGRRPAPRPCAPLATLPSAPFGLVIIASETTGRRLPHRRGTRRGLMPSSGPVARLRSPTPSECPQPALSSLLRWATAIPSNARQHRRSLPVRGQIPASIAILLFRSDGPTLTHEPHEFSANCCRSVTPSLTSVDGTRHSVTETEVRPTELTNGSGRHPVWTAVIPQARRPSTRTTPRARAPPPAASGAGRTAATDFGTPFNLSCHEIGLRLRLGEAARPTAGSSHSPAMPSRGAGACPEIRCDGSAGEPARRLERAVARCGRADWRYQCSRWASAPHWASVRARCPHELARWRPAGQTADETAVSV